MQLADYQDRFTTADVFRDENGVLFVRLHSKGESLWWGGRPHRELPELFAAIASDRDNRVVILTGSGDAFITISDRSGFDRDLPRGRISAAEWDQIMFEGNRLVNEHLSIEVPMIAAVNGPVVAHAELALLSDIVLCAGHTYFQDQAHFPTGLVPGDSTHLLWTMLLGVNRARHFLWSGARLEADESLRLGVVGEVLPPGQLIARATELAQQLARLNPILLRNTRKILIRPIKRAMAEDLDTGLALEALASLSGKEGEA